MEIAVVLCCVGGDDKSNHSVAFSECFPPLWLACSVKCNHEVLKFLLVTSHTTHLDERSEANIPWSLLWGDS